MVRVMKQMHKVMINAATLLEVVVALVIICAVVGLTIMIYTQLVGSTLSVKKYKAILILHQEALRSVKEKDWDEEEYPLDQYTVIKSTEDWAECEDVKVLILEARDAQGKRVAIRKELVYIP
jgi:type II secretory pathway pseudopilin PulG